MATLWTLNSSRLILQGSMVQFSDQGSPVTIGFFPIYNGSISYLPQPWMCLGVGYAIGLNNNGTIQFVGLETPEGYPLLSQPTSTSQLTLLSADTTNNGIWLNQTWTGHFGSKIATYILRPSLLYQEVGYNSPLPLFLSSCQTCGCGSNGNCNADGSCDSQHPHVCPDENTVPCGYNGNCFGYCFQGFTCESIDGTPSCITDNDTGTLFYVATGSIVLIFIVALFAILFAFLFIPPPPPAPILVTRPTSVPVNVLPTVAVGNNYLP